jgi:hypothetical protein
MKSDMIQSEYLRGVEKILDCVAEDMIRRGDQIIYILVEIIKICKDFEMSMK